MFIVISCNFAFVMMLNISMYLQQEIASVVNLVSMRYYELVLDKKDQYPKVMVELMHITIDNMQAFFNTWFNKQLPPSLGP
jgi:hypothetical protein